MLGQSHGGETVPSRTTLRKSCEACRLSKSKCIVNKLSSNICERCAKDGRQCVFAETRPRPKKEKTSKARVAEMEQKLDGIFALLSETRKAQDVDPSRSASPPSSIGPPTSLVSSDLSLLQDGSSSSYVADVFPFSSGITSPFPRFDVLQDVIGKGIISFDDAELLVQDFRRHAASFPFVVLSPNLSLDALRREKPTLLLAILAMSCPNLQVQTRLEQELRQSLSVKTIINGEKSIDLLQGMIVYVTWYHFHFRPDRQQIYQMSQMAIAMAVDLEITRPLHPGSLNNSSPGFEILRDESGGTKLWSAHIEAKRTFLGCYYMSSCLASGFRRPNSLKYTDYTGDCCQIVAERQEMLTDRLIPCFIRLQRLSEDIGDSFGYDLSNQLPPLGAVRIENFIHTFNRQLMEIEAAFAAEISETMALKLSCRYLRVYMNEIGFHAQSSLEITNGVSSRQDWYFAISRSDILLRCLEAAKDYFDFYLTVQTEEMRWQTLMDLIGIVYVVLMLAKFVSGVDAPHLDAMEVRKSVNMGFYTEAMANNINSSIEFINGQEQYNFFWHFRQVFQYMKLWHDEQLLGGESTIRKSLDSSTDFSFLRILFFVDNDLSYDCGGSASVIIPPQNTRSQDEIWSEIMEHWPQSIDPLQMLVNHM